MLASADNTLAARGASGALTVSTSGLKQGSYEGDDIEQILIVGELEQCGSHGDTVPVLRLGAEDILPEVI